MRSTRSDDIIRGTLESGACRLSKHPYSNRVAYSRYVEEFSHLKLPLSVRANGPDLKPREDIRIRDTAPIILHAPDSVELTERVWAPRADLQFSLREAQLPEKHTVFDSRVSFLRIHCACRSEVDYVEGIC